MKLYRNLIPAAWLVVATIHSAQADFNYTGVYNRENGIGAAVRVSRNYPPHTEKVQGFSPNWTQVVEVGVGRLLYYNEQTGAAAMAEAALDGSMATTRRFAFSTGWSSITYHQGHVMFYNKASGLAVVADFQSRSGELRQYPALYRFSTGWTHIVSSQNALVFYNAADGSGATGGWTFSYGNCTGFCAPADVRFQQQRSFAPGTFSLGWTHILETGWGVMFYNSTNGLSVMTDVTPAGVILTRSSTVRYLASGWTSLSLTQDCLLFYNKDTGDVAIGHITTRQELTPEAGHYSVDQLLPGYFSRGWTHIFNFTVKFDLGLGNFPWDVKH